jgi:hydrogenase nickel incorporation protein HypA/HybF
MHERSLVKSLIRQVEDLSRKHAGSRVLSIRVRIGEFSGVEADLLSAAYDDLVQDTPLRGAQLEIQKVPLEAVCQQCGHKFQIERFRFECDKCGSLRLTLHGGEELLLESVTFEENQVDEQKPTHRDARGHPVSA